MPDALPDIAALLPHQPPMRLLDRVLAWSMERLDAEVRLGPGSAFLEPAGVPAYVGIEYLGQAAAAYFTLAAQAAGTPARAAGAAPQAGMLVACPRYHCSLPAFTEGSTLTVRVWPASPVHASLVRFEGEIRLGDDVIAAGELSVYMKAAEVT